MPFTTVLSYPSGTEIQKDETPALSSLVHLLLYNLEVVLEWIQQGIRQHKLCVCDIKAQQYNSHPFPWIYLSLFICLKDFIYLFHGERDHK